MLIGLSLMVALASSPAAASDDTKEVAGTITKRTLYDISSSVPIVDGKAGEAVVTISASFEVTTEDGEASTFSWRNKPETKVIDKSGKPATFGDVQKGDKATVKLAGSNGSWSAVQITLVEKDVEPAKKAE
jgi:hypothetical protein